MEQIESSYSTLSCKGLLDKVIPNYAMGKVENCIFWERGFNDTYKIKGEDADYILRVYRFGRRSLDDIEFEVDVLLHLNRMNVAVSYPLAKSDGTYITPVSTAEGVRYAIVTAFAKGIPFTYENLDEAYLYGESVARVHNATEGFKSKRRRLKLDEKFLIDDPIALVKGFSGIKSEDVEYIIRLSSRLSAYLAQVDSASLDYGFCHGDFHGWNAHKSSRGVEFFDFDFCGYGFRSYELSVFRWSARLRGKESERWSEFVSGYQSIRKIKQVDLDLTVAFMAVRDIWLIGQHIENTGVFGQNWMNMEYFKKRVNFLKKLEEELFGGSLS